MKIGPKYKIARRLGPAVFDKTQTQKFQLSEARHARGKGRGGRPKSRSDFALTLIEKQRVRFSYGITERQLVNYVKRASAIKVGSASDHLFVALESRLDNAVYRLGLANSRRLARQMVSHGHITVNGRKTTIPSYSLRIGDTISIREGSKKSALFLDLGKRLQNYSIPKWLKFDIEKMQATVEGTPVLEKDGAINFGAVFEYYSR